MGTFMKMANGVGKFITLFTIIIKLKPTQVVQYVIKYYALVYNQYIYLIIYRNVQIISFKLQ